MNVYIYIHFCVACRTHTHKSTYISSTHIQSVQPGVVHFLDEGSQMGSSPLPVTIVSIEQEKSASARFSTSSSSFLQRTVYSYLDFYTRDQYHYQTTHQAARLHCHLACLPPKLSLFVQHQDYFVFVTFCNKVAKKLF